MVWINTHDFVLWLAHSSLLEVGLRQRCNERNFKNVWMGLKCKFMYRVWQWNDCGRNSVSLTHLILTFPVTSPTMVGLFLSYAWDGFIQLFQIFPLIRRFSPYILQEKVDGPDTQQYCSCKLKCLLEVTDWAKWTHLWYNHCAKSSWSPKYTFLRGCKNF